MKNSHPMTRPTKAPVHLGKVSSPKGVGTKLASTTATRNVAKVAPKVSRMRTSKSVGKVGYSM